MCAWSCSWLSAHVFAVVAYEHGAVQLRHNAALSGKEVYIAAYYALRLCGGYDCALLQAKAAALAFLFKLYVIGIVVISAQAELVAAVYAAYFLFKCGVVHIVKIKAGYFVASAEKDGVELILVLFGDYENKVKGEYRFENAAKFFDWGFANFVSVDAGTLGLESTMQLPVSNASLEDAEGGLLTANIDFSAAKLTGLKETINAITATPSLLTSSYVTSRKLEAPIAAGEELGTVSYQYNGVTMFTAPLIASRDVAEAATVVSDTASPNSSPLIVSSPDVNDKEGGSGWLFWVLLIAALVIIVLIAKVLSSRRRRRRAKKRRAYRSNYPRR